LRTRSRDSVLWLGVVRLAVTGPTPALSASVPIQTSVPMAKTRIPDGTLKSILDLANVTIEEFRRALR
jgi:hypothetical protein